MQIMVVRYKCRTQITMFIIMFTDVQFQKMNMATAVLSCGLEGRSEETNARSLRNKRLHTGRASSRRLLDRARSAWMPMHSAVSGPDYGSRQSSGKLILAGAGDGWVGNLPFRLARKVGRMVAMGAVGDREGGRADGRGERPESRNRGLFTNF